MTKLDWTWEWCVTPRYV